MKRTIRHPSGSLVLGIALAVAAKTPDQLKTELANILPAGKKARVCWIEGGTIGNDDYPNEAHKTLKGVDSDDGVVREIVAASPTMWAYNPQITNDGTRIVFQNKVDESIYTIPWGGGTPKKIVYGFVNDYWYDAATGKDFVLMSVHEVMDATVSIMNLDNASDKKTLWNVANKMPDPDDGIGITPDGKRLVGFFGPDYIGTCVDWQAKTLSYQTQGDRGCVLSAGGSNDQYMHQLNRHVNIGIFNCNGTQAKTIDITTAVINSSIPKNSCYGAQEHQYTRWCNNTDYVTTAMDFTTSNPFIVKLSDPTKFVALQDNVGCLRVKKSDLKIADSWGTTGAAARPAADVRTNATPVVAVFDARGTLVARTNVRGMSRENLVPKRSRPGMYLVKTHGTCAAIVIP